MTSMNISTNFLGPCRYQVRVNRLKLCQLSGIGNEVHRLLHPLFALPGIPSCLGHLWKHQFWESEQETPALRSLPDVPGRARCSVAAGWTVAVFHPFPGLKRVPRAVRCLCHQCQSAPSPTPRAPAHPAPPWDGLLLHPWPAGH